METTLINMDKKIQILMGSSARSISSPIPATSEDINGINIMHIPAKNVYSFGLQLLEIIFTKEEVQTLFFSSPKKDPNLDYLLKKYLNIYH